MESKESVLNCFGCLFFWVMPFGGLIALIGITQYLICFEDAIINPIKSGNYLPIIVFLFLFIIIFAYIGWLIIKEIKDKYEDKHKNLEDNYKNKVRLLNVEHDKKLLQLELRKEELDKREKQIEYLTNGDGYLFGKIPQAVADLKTLDFVLTAKYLEHKPHPAYGTAELIKRQFRNKAKEAIKAETIATYKLQALLAIFPQLNDYVDDEDGLDELSQYVNYTEFIDNRDSARDYLSDAEWKSLSTIERNQLALNRYIEKRNKSNWAIGRDYEMLCAHKLREKGYIVEMHGIEKRLEDLGRDLIAVKNRDLFNDDIHEVFVIQCKFWGKNKIIRENVALQLFGTTIAYDIEKFGLAPNIKVIPVLMIPRFSILSEIAQNFIRRLGIHIEYQDMTNFPRIKCNINNGNKIYHLPFDQQYDRAQIKNTGEFYAYTVAEAESKGFRRAMRHIIS